MSKKLIVIVSGVLIIIGGYLGYQAYFTEKKPDFETTKVKRGELAQLVTGTGSLVPRDDIQIEPETQAQVRGVLTEVGDKVNAGDLLVQLKNTNQNLAYKEAQAKLETTKEKIGLAKTRVENAEWNLEKTDQSTKASIESARSKLKSASTTLASKKQNLADLKDEMQTKLRHAYQNARDVIDGKEIVAKNALHKLDQFEDSYFNTNDQIGIKVRGKVDRFESKLSEARNITAKAGRTKSKDDTKLALKELKGALKEAKTALVYIRDDAFEDPRYNYDVSATDKTSAEEYKSSVQAGIKALNGAQQKIESTEAAYQKTINSAQAALSSAQVSLKTARSNLNQVKTQTDQNLTKTKTSLTEAKKQLSVEKSRLKSLRAQIQQAEEKVANTKIEAPMDGVITKVHLERGETARPGQVALNLMPKKGYVIKADISEVDIGAVDEGDKVKVDFDAFSDEGYTGKVVQIYPSETAKQGVIYYRIEVQLEKYPEKLKPGLTANLDIISAKKDNALMVPYVALRSENGEDYVKVLKDGNVEKKDVTLGIEGEMEVEIKKGLKEGEKVIISNK